MPSKKNVSSVDTHVLDESHTNKRIVKQISQLEHAKRKSMWVGSKKVQTTEMYCINDKRFNFQNTQVFQVLKFALQSCSDLTTEDAPYANIICILN